MFTGIIEETGRVIDRAQRGEAARLVVEASHVLSDTRVGASIAVNGACLTAVDLGGESFSADLSPETLEKTNLGELQRGAIVNLERPLAASGRLDGHFVLGHVDGVGELIGLESLGDGNWWLRVRVPAELERYLVYKGSVAVDGISLTVARAEGTEIGIAVVPHTYEKTRLRSLEPGARLNIECDVLAKHIEKLIQGSQFSSGPEFSIDHLRGHGY